MNELSGSEWIKFTKSWLIEDGKSSEITKEVHLHPASFPPSLISQFIEFFTKEDEWVLDPFLGTGSTLVACDKTKRNGVGVELYEKYVQNAQKRTEQTIIQSDIREAIEKLEKQHEFSLCITSPPYFNILKKEKDYNQQKRLKMGYDLKYGEEDKDIGNIDNYKDFINEMKEIFRKIRKLLKSKGHLIIIIQNIRHKGEMIPLAFDLAKELGTTDYKFLGERIWCQNQKILRPYGYPFAFVPNIHHHYILIFQKID